MRKNVADFDGEINSRSDEYDENETQKQEDDTDDEADFDALLGFDRLAPGFQPTVEAMEAVFVERAGDDAESSMGTEKFFGDALTDKLSADFLFCMIDGRGQVISTFESAQSISDRGYYVCPLFTVVGDALDPNTGHECLAIQFRDRYKRRCDLLIPRALIAEGGTKLAAFLAANSFDVPTGKKLRERVQTLLHMLHGPRVVIARRTGWHGDVFVLPKRIIGDPGTARIVTDLSDSLKMGTRGTDAGWQSGVAGRCQNNSRLLLSLSLPFASSLLRFAPSITPTMVHFFGPSSIGKSTAGLVAGSVWGGSEDNGLGYSESWNGTLNAQMAKAALRSHTLLVLDEMRAGENVAKMAYAVSSGQSRGRLDKSANLRSEEKFSVFSLSTGEVTFEEMERLGNQRAQTFDGAEMRLPSIPADAGVGLGIFEDVHGAEKGRKVVGNGAAEFANRIQEAARENYGWAGPLFVERLLDHMSSMDDDRGFPSRLGSSIDRFVASLQLDAAADDAVKRLARTFGLIAAAGELASDFEVVPIPADEMAAGVRKCFNDWLASRGGARSKTAATALVALRDCISKNMGKFVLVADAAGTQPGTVYGYRQPGNERTRGIFYVLPGAWKEILATAPRAKLGEELDKLGLLIRQKSATGNTDQVVKQFKNAPGVRAYAVSERILEVGDDGTLPDQDGSDMSGDSGARVVNFDDAKRVAKSLRTQAR